MGTKDPRRLGIGDQMVPIPWTAPFLYVAIGAAVGIENDLRRVACERCFQRAFEIRAGGIHFDRFEGDVPAKG